MAVNFKEEAERLLSVPPFLITFCSSLITISSKCASCGFLLDVYFFFPPLSQCPWGEDPLIGFVPNLTRPQLSGGPGGCHKQEKSCSQSK